MNATDSQKERSTKELFSYHAFLLPFRWDCASKYRKPRNPKTSFNINTKDDDRLSVKAFERALGNGKWTYRPFEIKYATDYNEYVYFYPHAQKVLFNAHETLAKGLEQKAASYCFDYNIGKKTDDGNDSLYFHIHIKNANTYSLTVESITLSIFDTGIGILKFGLINREYKDIRDILLINDFGRRIYPQFLGEIDESSKSSPIEITRDKFYPSLVELSEKKVSEFRTCKFESDYYNNLIKKASSSSNKGNEHQLKQIDTGFDLSTNPIVQKLPHYIHDLFGTRFKTQLDDIERRDVLITPVIDDRMFVVCVYGECDFNRLSDDMWYRLLFVDGRSKGADNAPFENELIQNHSNDRWIKSGTRYGISRYSFVATVRGSLTTQFPKIILTHCKTMYLRAVSLSLTQRASIIRFSEEIAHISRLRENQAFRKTDELYRHYIQFVNKYHFTEITAQEQGIEIYSMIQKHMGIRENLAALREEISDLHAYADLVSEKNRGKSANRLNWIVALFLVPTLITGYFGMNVFEKDDFFDISLKWIPWIHEVSFSSIAYYIPPLFLSLFIICLSWLFIKWFGINIFNYGRFKINSMFKGSSKKGKS